MKNHTEVPGTVKGADGLREKHTHMQEPLLWSLREEKASKSKQA